MPHPELLVYIAAPYSPTAAQLARRQPQPILQDTYDREFAATCIQANKEAAAALGLEVARLGCMPVVPHTAHGGRPELETVQDYRFWIDGTAALLFGCGAALFAENWRDSSGAVGEHDRCIEWSIPIFYSVGELARWVAAGEQNGTLEREALSRLHARICDALLATDPDDDSPIPYRLPSVMPPPATEPQRA